MSLIDKDKTLDAISMYLFVNDAVRNDVKVGDYRVFAKSMICDVPEVDIVRCKECKWRTDDNACDLNCRIDYLDGTETDMWFYVKPNDFCSYGERSEP